MPIISFGIFLPNGRFLPNNGDGHAKNASRFCEQYPLLNQLKNDENNLNPDEFLITAGCCIVAGYNGNKCVKVAENNRNPKIIGIINEYQCLGYEIWPYWSIKNEYKNVLDAIMANMSNMRIIIRNEVLDSMELNGKTGFLMGGKFYSNSGKGHESNARDIIHENGWDNEWVTGDAQDFLVLKKRAIQIGSGIYSKKIIAARKFYNESTIERVIKKYKLSDYSHDLIS